MRLRSFSIALALAIVSVAGSASGQPAESKPVPALGDVLTGDARAAYEAARLLFTDGDFAGASLKMQHAYELSKEPRLLWNIAACEKKLRHYARVVTLVEKYQSDGASLLTPDEAKEAREILETMRPYITRVTVNVDQPGAAVSIDDVEVGQSPLGKPVLVDMGQHALRVVKTGFLPWNESRNFPGQTELVIDARLAPEPREGRLVVVAGAQDRISVDGTPRGVGQLSEPVSIGSHKLQVSASGMRPHEEDVTVRGGETRTINVALQPEGGSRTWLWVGIGGGVLAAAAVALTLVLTSSTETTGPARPGTMNPNIIELVFPGRGR